MATIAQTGTRQQTGGVFADWLSGAVYGTSKWSGSTAADLFVPAGTIIRAPISGTVTSSSASGPEGSHPIIYLRGDDGTVLRFLHDQATTQGHVQAGQPIGRVGDNTLTAAYQHVDLSVSRTGSFQPGPGGGEIDARQWLQSIGFTGTQLPVRTGGIQEMLSGQPPYPGYGQGPSGGSLLGSPPADLSGLDTSGLNLEGWQASLAGGASGGGGSSFDSGQTQGPTEIKFKNPFADLGEGFKDFPRWALAAVGVGLVVLAVQQADEHTALVLAGLTLLAVLVMNDQVREQLSALLSGRAGEVGAQQLALAYKGAGGSGSPASSAGATGSALSANTGSSSGSGPGSLAGVGGSLAPARISFPYGGTPYSYGGRTSHGGVDLVSEQGATQGRTFYEPAALGEGTVRYILPEGTGPGTSNAGGQGIIVQLATGVYEHFYHVGQALVSVGQHIVGGQPVGTVGLAGPGDSHLHVELRSTAGLTGQTFDPTPYLRGVFR